MRIVIAGPGLMGSQIGVEYALAGHAVVFLARDAAKAEQRIDAAWQTAGAVDRWPDAAFDDGRRRLSVVSAFSDVDGPVDLVLESVVEDAEAKGIVLRAAAERFPDAMLASNTSSISIGRLGELSGAPERTIGNHYWNPPLLMPLVEVISGPKSDPAVVQRSVELIASVGKRPVVVEKDVDGFVWNRLQVALLRVAVWIVENGVASPGVVDEIVRDGLARRWRYTGPFETAALGGPDTFTRVANNLWPVLSNADRVEDLGRWLIDDAGILGEIKARRDDGLLRDLERDE
ncbi:MAG: 3-hydroxyacyl-CoA dehydrogenase family protein [Thermomicrobiales bacterium]